MKYIHTTETESGEVVWQHWLSADASYSTDADRTYEVDDAVYEELRTTHVACTMLAMRYHNLLTRIEGVGTLPYVVGDTKSNMKPRRFDTEDAASEYIATLPDYQSGRYYLDGPSDDD